MLSAAHSGGRQVMLEPATSYISITYELHYHTAQRSDTRPPVNSSVFPLMHLLQLCKYLNINSGVNFMKPSRKLIKALIIASKMCVRSKFIAYINHYIT